MGFNRVLVIEDDLVVRYLTSRIIKQTQLAGLVFFALNGRQGLETVKAGLCDLILLDINLPLMNGFEFLDALTQLRLAEGIPIPPVFILTNSARPEDKARAAQYPVVRGYLEKPFTVGHTEHLAGFSRVGAEQETA